MISLMIRLFLYALAGATAWQGAVTMTGPENACIHIPALAEALSGYVNGYAGIASGSAIGILSFIWSRIAKSKGKLT